MFEEHPVFKNVFFRKIAEMETRSVTDILFIQQLERELAASNQTQSEMNKIRRENDELRFELQNIQRYFR